MTANRTTALLTRPVFRRDPFAPRALPRFLTTTGLSDSRRWPPPKLLIPLAACRLARHQGGSPKFPTVLSACAAPYHPGEPRRCPRSFLPAGCRLRPSLRVGRSHLSNEAETGSLALRLTHSPPQAPAPELLPLTAGSATCSTINLHGRFLSFCENSQAYLGAQARDKELTATPLSFSTSVSELLRCPLPL